jgi:NitT/TauT family transport system substrate-binding protein
LFALATAPKTANEIKTVKDLENRTVGISGLGNADQTILLFLLKKAGADASKVRFATIGTNLYDALRIGQVDAGIVQEPALSLLTTAGGRSIVNAMDLADAEKCLGGAYEFMGTSVRADEFERRRDQMRRLARALAKGLVDSRTMPPDEVVAALPKELVAGGDRPQLIAMLERYRRDLFPDNVKIDKQAVDRVIEAHKVASLVEPGVDFAGLLDFSVVEP